VQATWASKVREKAHVCCTDAAAAAAKKAMDSDETGRYFCERPGAGESLLSALQRQD